MRDVYGEMRAMAADILVFAVSDRDESVGKLTPALREAHECRTRAFHAIVEAGQALNRGDYAMARDCFRDVAFLAEQAFGSINAHERIES